MGLAHKGRWVALMVTAVFVFTGCGAHNEPTGAMAQAPMKQSRTDKASESYGYCPAWPGGTGILADGDFSQALDDGVGAIPKGTVFAPDWKSDGPETIDFEASNFPYWKAPNDVCTVDMDGTPGPGSIRHGDFRTKKRASYTVTFQMSANGSCGPTIKKMFVAADGQSQAYTWDTSGGNDAQDGDWAQETFQFKAIRPISNLLFRSEDPKGGNCGAIVAAIVVTKD
jgi:hypothetical protein